MSLLKDFQNKRQSAVLNEQLQEHIDEFAKQKQSIKAISWTNWYNNLVKFLSNVVHQSNIALWQVDPTNQILLIQTQERKKIANEMLNLLKV